ncbi:NAD(P)/FAD-dependent oxidoreductase [Lacimicrobium alkaliphilum]|uniref:FAD-dependent oxidoreductase n=1 Tax=Lacimicrobium alkaliphilum TaxID=1526571 RepID=A0A0U2ZJH1_9ALTE|nr:FAD-dependent oxidoreductase [Lacimicrobium alkaliphilum]ALS99159.1 FAD-dependent oxidoreductase [Lacimicrobium alkaliphilum]
MRKRIAIIGSGISGLVCGHLLHPKHDICLYESEDYIGGHTHTVDIEVNGLTYALDTGFIVFNDWTYPNFIALMDKLGVKKQATEMSFSVKNLGNSLEYNGNNINSLFAQRRNLLRPWFYRFLGEILRFNKTCKQVLEKDTQSLPLTLGDFIYQQGFSDHFADNYILPMCAAIWSASLDDARQFPLRFFLQFFNNHGLLNVNHRPQWYTLIGGSRAYIAPMIQGFENNIMLRSPVQSVSQSDKGYNVSAANQPDRKFDEVIFACHSDQALALLAAPSTMQKEILGAMPYSSNEVVLHTDTSLLPKRKLAWASWNYLLKQNVSAQQPASVTYNMNILQRLRADTTFCVTLNNTQDIAPEKILREFSYSHPQFDLNGLKARARRDEICGQDGLHFCGAYWYNGFHEDGVRSALDVCQRFGASL